MAHTCPECGMACHCGGDIDDICFGDNLACICDCCDLVDEDDDEDFDWEQPLINEKRDMSKEIKLQWKPAPFECDKCGSESEVLTQSKEDWYYFDEEEVRCVDKDCGNTGIVYCADEEASVTWRDELNA